MALWCRDLPLVTVARSRVPKPVTLIVPYYCNPVFLARQLDHWLTFGALREHLAIIIVDDGSPETPAADVVARQSPSHRRQVRVFRIEEDRRWNWLAARNIGFHHASEGWCLVTDIDHLVPKDTLEACLYGVHDTRVAYAFARREHTGAAIHPHSASFLLTRALFWQTGGYDEALSGYYGSDGEFRKRLARIAPLKVLTDTLIRYERVGDSSTTRYLRKQPEDAAVRRLVAARTVDWRPRVLSFPYTEVTT